MSGICVIGVVVGSVVVGVGVGIGVVGGSLVWEVVRAWKSVVRGRRREWGGAVVDGDVADTGVELCC